MRIHALLKPFIKKIICLPSVSMDGGVVEIVQKNSFLNRLVQISNQPAAINFAIPIYGWGMFGLHCINCQTFGTVFTLWPSCVLLGNLTESYCI